MKKTLIAAALAVSLAVIACDDGTDPTAAPTAGPTAATTEAPATEAPATEAPATEAPATEAPATETPATEAPVVSPQVTGVIILPEGGDVPADATVTVIIEDQSLADAPAVSMGSQQISGADVEGSEIPFAVDYDPATIVEADSYGMRVRIEDGEGSLIFTNDTNVPVITANEPLEGVVVAVIPVAG